MLTATDFWHLVEHIIPLYAILVVSYGLNKLNFIEPVHAPGISRWVSFLGVPLYVFHLLAFNDPYQISLRLVGADVLQKFIVLIASCLWWKFSKSGCIEGVIGFFMLATLPNTVLVGDALLQPLYGEEVEVQVVTIIFLQSLIWYNLCIVLYELRVVLIEDKLSLEMQYEKDHVIEVNGSGSIRVIASSPLDPSSRLHEVIDVVCVTTQAPHTGTEEHRLTHGSPPTNAKEATLQRTISAPARVSFSRSLPFKFTTSRVFDLSMEEASISGSLGSTGEKSLVFSGVEETDTSEQTTEMSLDDPEKSFGSQKSCDHGQSERFSEASNTDSGKKRDVILNPKSTSRKVILLRMLNRVKKVPLTYASIIGLVYSLVAQKYDWKMPYPIRTSVELISQGAIGMAIFLMGMAWARSGSLFSCGRKAIIYGSITRFLIGPITMIISSAATQMHGSAFRFAVLQAVIPQGVISFVLAKEYGVDVDLFNTAVILQLVIFLPIALCYYYILEEV